MVCYSLPNNGQLSSSELKSCPVTLLQVGNMRDLVGKVSARMQENPAKLLIIYFKCFDYQFNSWQMEAALTFARLW